MQVAKVKGIGQPDMSRMLRGRSRDFSVERLMRFLTAPGCEADIVVRASGQPGKAAYAIHLQSAAP